MTVAHIGVSPIARPAGGGKGEDPHAHENEQINIYFNGIMRMKVEDQIKDVGDGWVVVIPPNVVHTGLGILDPTIQINFSSPARGKGYVDFIKGVTHANEKADKKEA